MVPLWVALTHSAILTCIFPYTLALLRPDAGVTDWYKPFVGLPLTHFPKVSPRFIERGQPNGSSILLASQKHFLASLSSIDGSIEWRDLFDESEPITGIWAHQNRLVLLSGHGGVTIRSVEAKDGTFLWERPLHDSSLTRVSDPSRAGVDLVFLESDSATDIVVLSNSMDVRRFHGDTGAVKWHWKASDEGSLTTHTQLAASGSTLYIISLAKSFASYTLHITVLDSGSGRQLSSHHVPSALKDGLEDIVILSSLSLSSSHLLWIEAGGIVKGLGLPPSGFVMKPLTVKGARGISRIIDVGLRHYVLAEKDDGTTLVLKFDAIEIVSSLLIPDLGSAAPLSKSLYSLSSNAHDGASLLHIAQTKGSDKLLAKIYNTQDATIIKSYEIAFENGLYGGIETAFLHWTTEGLLQLLFVSSTGSLQLWQDDVTRAGAESKDLLAFVWLREESLSDIVQTEIVDLPEKQELRPHVASNERFVEKLLRHAIELQNLPAFLYHFVLRFTTGGYETFSSVAVVTASSSPASNDFYRDSFGFRKVVMVITKHGTVYSLDSRNGAIIWARYLGAISEPQLFMARTVWDGEETVHPELLVVAREASTGGTVAWRLKALTGEGNTEATTLCKLGCKNLMLHKEANGSFLIGVNEVSEISFHPIDISQAQASPSRRLNFFQIESLVNNRQRVAGYSIDASCRTASLTWTHTIPTSDTLSYTFLPASRAHPVASYGKVLADRSTLYKYLNPHIVGVITTSNTKGAESVSLIDSISGSILYHAVVRATPRSLRAVLTENWLVYTYSLHSDAQEGALDRRGEHVVIVEFYEGKGVNEKTSSSDTSSFTYDSQLLHVIQNSFVLPQGITALGITATKYGISSKDLVVATSKHQIQSVPRRLLDPRRHKNKPLAADAEEFLTPYDTVVPDDHKRVLSHDHEVMGVRSIVASPALLESTSLIFAYGHDLFFTRLAPSNTFDVLSESFNKVQLVLTIVGLTIAILITKPIVERKHLRERWYS